MQLRDCLKLAMVLSFIFAGHPAASQEKKQLAEECLAAIESGDQDRVVEIAETMKSWRTIFATKLIMDARTCLGQATGEAWEYNYQHSMFQNSREAKEQLEAAKLKKEKRRLALIERKCILKDDIQRYEGEIFSAQNEVEDQLEAARSEVFLEMMNRCELWFKEDKQSAILSPVCNKVFIEVGFPDSIDYSFIAERRSSIEVARRNLKKAQGDLAIVERFNMFPSEYFEMKLEQTSSQTKPEASECAPYESKNGRRQVVDQ